MLLFAFSTFEKIIDEKETILFVSLIVSFSEIGSNTKIIFQQ